jgi:hypothetical protein
MKLTALLLAVPLAFGATAVWADSMTTTETTVTNPAVPTTGTTSSSERMVTPDGKVVEKSATMTQGADGSVSIDQSKTVTKP